MPLFSVIIPCHNSGDRLHETLESVFGQEFQDFEVIAVDDGSTDNTLSVLRQYEHQIRVLTQENEGAGSARNHAIRYAQGEYIAPLDSDDVWFPGSLGAMAAVIRDKQPAVVAGCAWSFHGDSPALPPERSEGVQVRTFCHPLDAAEKGNHWLLLMGAAALRRIEVLSAGGFAEGRINGEDTHLYLKLGLAERCCVIDAPLLFGYRHHEANSIRCGIRGFRGAVFLLE